MRALLRGRFFGTSAHGQTPPNTHTPCRRVIIALVHLVAEEPLCAVLVLPVLTLALALEVERVRVRRVGAVGLKVKVGRLRL